MNTVDLIAKKRDGGALSTQEIEWLIANYADGAIPDYQMAAWAMAVVLRGMDLRETVDLTLAMARSGEMLDLHGVAPVTVDKHSTGGVGDKTTLLLAPLVASLGLPVAKMSGRGLGFSGGTIDKLESIPGLRTDVTPEEFRRSVRDIGLVIASQTIDLAPADKRLYALRDLTATVESIPLIAASVMSKKLAAGADCIVLDVKYGAGAFMRTLEQAHLLARTMVDIGQCAGRRIAAVLSSMEQPLGYAVGNALEIREAVAALRGAGPSDLVELCMQLGTQLLLLTRNLEGSPTKATLDADEARHMLEHTRLSGAAWHMFRQMVTNQGGDLAALDAIADDADSSAFALLRAPVVIGLYAPQDGYVASIQPRAFGLALSDLGGGRKRKDDAIDPAVGFILVAKVGDAVAAGDPLLYIHAASESDATHVAPHLIAAYTFTDQPPDTPSLVSEVITVEA